MNEQQKPTGVEKLTKEEKDYRFMFIGKCVDRNIQLALSNRMGVARPIAVQELVNSSRDTLTVLGKQISKAITEYDPEFDKEDELKIGSILASDWKKFIKLQIKKIDYAEFARRQNNLVKELKATIDAAKTPEEIRKEAEERLANLSLIAEED